MKILWFTVPLWISMSALCMNARVKACTKTLRVFSIDSLWRVEVPCQCLTMRLRRSDSQSLDPAD